MTFTVPPAIANCLIEIATQERSPAYLQINTEGQLISWTGSVLTYGLKALQAGDYIGDHLCFLDGLLPLAQPHEVLSTLQIEQGPVIDVHLLLSPAQAEPNEITTGWIVLLDVSVDTEYPKALQQQINELSLLKYQYAKLLNRSFSQPQSNQAPDAQATESQATDSQPPVSQAPSTRAPEPQNNVNNTLSDNFQLEANQEHSATGDPLAVHKDISVVLIELFGPKENISKDNPLKKVNSTDNHPSENQTSATEMTLPSITTAIAKIAQTVMEEGGVINHVLGKTVVAFFGLVPTNTAPARQALSTAKRLLSSPLAGTSPDTSSGTTLSSLPNASQSPTSLGIAVATGPASTGVIELNGHQVLNAIGPHIQNALGLRSFIQPNIILVDPITLQGLDTLKESYHTQVLNTHDNHPDLSLLVPELYELTFALE